MDGHFEQPLHELVKDDEFHQEVEERLEDPNERDYTGRTLLHVAAWSLEDNDKILQLLLDRGAKVNAVTPEGCTPLHYAVNIKKRRKVVALLDAGASVNFRDSRGRSVLHFAAKKRWPGSPSPTVLDGCDISIVEILLCHPDINPNLVDDIGETPLLWAVREKSCDVVRALLKKGANPNICRRDNRNPLHVALLAEVPSDEIVKALLTNGASIYREDMFRLTPVDLLISGIYDHVNLHFASSFIKLIALRYQIKERLRRQLRWSPKLCYLFEKCCKEVKLMREVRVHAKFTLHDFALDCFQAQVESPVIAIHVHLVETLLTGLFSNYFSLILDRISVQDLREVLEKTTGRKVAENLVSIDASGRAIYEAISQYYEENEALKNRVGKYRGFLLTKI